MLQNNPMTCEKNIKAVLLILFSCVWLLACGQQEEKKNIEEEAIIITPIYHMPIFGTCIDDSLSYQEMKICSDDAFEDFFYGNLNFPKNQSTKLAKRAIVQFKIQKDGSISDVKFLRNKIPKAFEDEIKRVLQLMPCWKPGTIMGKDEEVNYSILVRMPEPEIDCKFLAERMPLFKGCEIKGSYEEQKRCSDQAMLKFFFKNFKYPKEIQQASFYLKILIRWKFEKDGSISNIEFLKESHESLEKEAKRVINLMPNWTPATQNGKPIEVCFTFPIHLHLR